MPDHLTLHARYAAIGLTEERLDPDRDNPRRFHKVFPAVPEEFKFYVTGGDDARDARKGHRVLLIDPPGLRKVQFIVRHPSYTRRSQPDRFDGGSGSIGVPIGGQVTVEAEANKDLSAGSLSLDGAVVCPLRPQTVRKGSEVVDPAAAVHRHVRGHRREQARHQGPRFSLTDSDGHTNRHGAKYMIQVAPDLKPTVGLKKSGVGLRISPWPCCPCKCRSRTTAGSPRRRSGPQVRRPQGRRVAAGGTQERRAAQVDTGLELDLEPMKLNPGTTVYVAAQATDTLPAVYGGPNVGESTALSFNVIKPEELMENLVRRQRSFAWSSSRRWPCRSARAKTEPPPASTPRARKTRKAGGCWPPRAAVQQSVGAEVAKAADTMEGIVEEMKYNRVGTQTEREKILSGVVKPLKDLIGTKDVAGPIVRSPAPERDQGRQGDQGTGRPGQGDRGSPERHLPADERHPPADGQAGEQAGVGQQAPTHHRLVGAGVQVDREEAGSGSREHLRLDHQTRHAARRQDGVSVGGRLTPGPEKGSGAFSWPSHLEVGRLYGKGS